MKRLVKNITLKIFILTMVSAMGFLIANKILFLHNHKLPDGSIVTHAHPFDKSEDSSPFKQHQHTQIQIFFLQHADLLCPLLLLTLIAVLVGNEIAKFHYLWQLQGLFHISIYQGRAPPSI